MQARQSVQHLNQRQVVRKTSLNLQGQAAGKLFDRIMIRLKVQKVVKHWKKLYKNSFNRYKRIEEWVNTEKTYIKDLKLIVQQIQKPLRQKGLITSDEEKLIFPNMDGIIKLSEEMHSTMEGVLGTWHPYRTQIAPAIKKLSSFFMIYIEYFNNYEKGKDVLFKLESRAQYKAIQKGLKMDIQSYLIKPTQRLVKYKLLLTDYQKKLRTDHPDYNPLTKVIQSYHEVVEKTNQALENQKRMRRMIVIQSKFKNILESSRQWKLEFDASFQHQDDRCKIYVFTDLLLVVLTKASKESLLKKILLSADSFVQICQDKIDQRVKRLFVAGKQSIGYFLFQSRQQRNRIGAQIGRIINSLTVNEQKRKSIMLKAQTKRQQSRASTTFRMSLQQFQQNNYLVFDDFNKLKKKFRVTVIGVERRFINRCRNSYFIVKLQLPFPEVICQRVFVKFQDVQDLENLLRISIQKWALVREVGFTKIAWKSVSELPKQLAKASQVDENTKLIDYRATRIQSFLNFVLRNKQTLKSSNLIFHKLKMFESLYEYLVDEKSECFACQACENGQIILNFQTYQQQLKGRLALKDQKSKQKFCIYRSFHTQNKLASQTKQNTRCKSEQILLYINSKLGYINVALTNRITQDHPMNISIYRPSYRDLQNQNNQTRQLSIQINIYKKDTISNILQMIKKSLKLQGIRDYGLILYNKQNISYILHQDEYIFDVIQQNKLMFSQGVTLGRQQNKSKLWGYMSKFKQSFQTKIDQIFKEKVPSTRLQLRKIYVFPAQIQNLTCSSDRVRRRILCDQIFYMFKNKSISLYHPSMLKFCTFFICIQYNQRLMLLRQSDIKRSLLENLFPSSRFNLVDSDFLNKIWERIDIYQQKQITQKQTFQTQLISLVNDNQGWNTQYFVVQNSSQKQLSHYCKDKYLKIGLNWQFFTITLLNSNVAIIKIRIDQLKVVYSGFCISVINSDSKEYRFICDNMFMFRSLLQKYEAFNKYFLGLDKTSGQSIMEETI